MLAVGALNSGISAVNAATEGHFSFKSRAASGDELAQVLDEMVDSDGMLLMGHDKGHDKTHDKDHAKVG